MAGWKLLGKKDAFKNTWSWTQLWKVKLPNGKVREFTMQKGKDFVLVLPITAKGKVLLIKQFYINEFKKIPALVAGYTEKDRTALDTAKRELMEETGYKAKKYVFLGKVIKGKYATGKALMYLAVGAEKASEQNLEDAEDIDVLPLTMKKFKKMLSEGKIRDAYAEVCARRALNYLETNQF